MANIFGRQHNNSSTAWKLEKVTCMVLKFERLTNFGPQRAPNNTEVFAVCP